MKRVIPVSALLVLLTAPAFPPSPVEAAAAGKVEDSIEVLRDMMKIPEKGIEPALLADATGVAIVPGVIKAGFVLGGEYGQGVLMIREQPGVWSPPIFVSIAGGSVGWQAGAEAIDVILVFKNKRSIAGITKGTFTLGADASIAAGPLGREASAATDVQLKAEIYSYSRSRGFFAGLAIEGAVLRVDDSQNEQFYGKGFSRAEDIAAGKGLDVPPAAKRLQAVLSEYARQGRN